MSLALADMNYDVKEKIEKIASPLAYVKGG